MNLFETIIYVLLVINTIGAIITVFREDRPVASIWAWLLVLILLPGIGFILYFFVGRRISNKRIYQLDERERIGITRLKEQYIDSAGRHKYWDEFSLPEQQMIALLDNSSHSILNMHNSYTMYVDGAAFMEALLNDMKQAKHHIDFQFYIVRSDELGRKFMDVMKERAAHGVKVRFLYDIVGGRHLKRRDLKELRAAGVHVTSFLGYSHWVQNLRLNFRNHRKQAVIDGRVAYLGGYNVSTDYLGEGPLGYWRDTHVRLEGDMVQAIEENFIKDWCASRRVHYEDFLREFGQMEPEDAYFSENTVTARAPMQLVASGPENDIDQIELGFAKMINMAQHSIRIQTPYFIPDDATFAALVSQALAGVDVQIMIPCKPDHPFVYRATEYYCHEALKYGMRIFRYDNGFLHTKVVTIDGAIASMGTANFDVRSFRLNFEVNAFVYDAAFTEALETQFERDKEQATELTREYFERQSLWRKFKQHFSRLLAPIL